MASSALGRNKTPRTGSAKWGRPSSRPLPVQHPNTTRSMDLDLTITGTPTPGLFTDRECPATSRLLQWPPEHLQRPGKGKTRVPKSTVWRTDNDLVEQIKAKLITGYEGVRQMFKAKDPYGDSIVTREGLFLILKALVGHISREQFDSFLKCICLHWRSSISFDEFIVRFHDNPEVALHSVNGLRHRQEETQQQYQPHLEDNLRSTDMLEWCPFTSAPHAFVVFRKRLQKGEVGVRDILPASCFLKDGRIIGPQLREALALCDLRLTDREFDHIWLKFDPDYNGTVSTKRFFECLGLAPNGYSRTDPRAIRSAKPSRRQPEAVQKRCKTETHTTKVSRSQTGPVTVTKVDTVEICGNRAEVISQQGQAGSKARDYLRGTGTVSRSTKEKRKEVEEEETTTTTTTTTRKKKTTTTTTKTTENGEQLVDDDKLAGHVRALISAKRAAPEFDSLLDNLNYKKCDRSNSQLEDTYRNLQSAFRLFDFMGDGYVAKIDFRRVLKEFGFDIAAVDLDAFLGRAGISVVQGLVNYKQFLYKFQTRGSSSVFNKCIIRDNESLNIGSKRIETEETLRAENMESGVSNFFHADYVKLLNMLKQKDKRNTGTVPASELRSAVNAVLKTNMTNAEFGELLARLTVSADLNSNSKSVGGPAIQYSSLLELLNSEPEHWNQKKDGHWTVHKYHLGDMAPASPVLRLQEKAKTWMAPPPERHKEANNRVAEIRKELTKLFTDRFHTFDKNFKDMDRRKSGYMSKWQFGALIKLCGITLSVKDLEFLWATLDTAADNTLSYVTLVKTFTGINHHQQQQKLHCNSAKLQTARPSTSILPQGITGTKAYHSGEDRPTQMVTVQQPHITPGSAKEGRLVELLKKVRDDVLDRWEEIYSLCLSLDRDGHASIAVQDMKDIMYKLKLPLSGPQRTELCNMFDLHANGWFHYVSFLQAIKKHTPGEHISPCVFDIHTKRLHRKAGPTSTALTVFDFLLELKTLLLKKYKTLRSSFKIFDQNRSGYIEETELRTSLGQMGYALSDQDFLDVLQVLDGSQAQRISFDDFKTVLLTL